MQRAVATESAARSAPSLAATRAVLGELAIVAAVTLACLLPFVDKALHIDDPFYVWVGQQVTEAPADFFGLTINWDGTERPLAAVNKNPPLISFFIAGIGGLMGWSEVALHLGFLLPALGVTLCTWALARRLRAPPVLAALGCLACPVFLVSATTVMSDVAMLALFCGSLAAWLRGVEDGRASWRWVAGALAALCVLTKYFGIALIPLLFVFGITRERRIGAWLLPLGLPLAAVFGYELYTDRVYGQGLLLRAASFSLGTRPDDVDVFGRWLVAGAFAGGALIPALFAAPWVLSRRAGALAAALAAAVVGVCLVRGRLGSAALGGAGGDDWNLLAHVVVFVAAGSVLLVLLIRSLALHRRDAGSLLLGFWGLGTFVFAAVVNYTTNGRALLPLAPVVGILLARGLASRDSAPLLRFGLLAPALVLGLAAARGDAALADASRVVAREIAETWQGRARALWFEGQWGFQYYMQEAGARPVDARRSVLRRGDVLITPLNSMARLGVSERAATRLDVIEIPTASMTTMAVDRAAGFYAIQWGPLPYRWLPGHRERFEVRRIDRLLMFESDPLEVARRRNEFRRALVGLSTLFALEDGDWPAETGPGSVSWGTCRPDFRSVARVAARECAWCSTTEQCRACRDTAVAVDPQCMALLDAAVVEQASRCLELREELLNALATACGDCRGDCAACRLRVGERSPAGPLCVAALEHELRLAGGEFP